MGYQTINIGSSANDGTGDGLRVAMGKIREMLQDLYGMTLLSPKDRDFGAAGDGSTDDTAALQDWIDALRATPNAAGWLPPNDVSAYYKTTAALTIDGPISIFGAGENAATILASGLSSGAAVLDVYCDSADSVEHLNLEGFTLRSNNGSPNALRLHNASYANTRRLRAYNVTNGLVISGTRCFTHKHELLSGYTISGSGVTWAAGFSGGGQFSFDTATLTGAYGLYLPATAVIDGLSLAGCNFEQCSTNSMRLSGTAAGVSVQGGRTEGCNGIDFMFRPYGSGEYVGGISIHGVAFDSSDAGGSARISIGGDSGLVRGFDICGNIVKHGSDLFSAALVSLNGAGEAGRIAGNWLRGTDASGAVACDTQRAGVIVEGNYNLSGLLPEYRGTALTKTRTEFTPTDGSGAGLTLTAATGQYTASDGGYRWQMVVTYPATANGSAAELAGLPVAPTQGTNNAGRAGAHVDWTDAGIDLGVLQGVTSSTEIKFYNRQTGAAVTNAQLSGKVIYLSGHYAV